MNLLDFIILLPLLYGAYLGFKRGFLMSIVKIVAVLLGVVLGFKLVHWGAEILAPYVGKAEKILPLLSFFMIFILVLFLVKLLGKAMKSFVDMILLGSIDNIAGAILNLIKWGFGVGLILWLMEVGDLILPRDIREGSLMHDFLIAFARNTIAFLSKITPFASDLVDYIHALQF